MNPKKIIIIDETLREGMQYRGIMFSQKQRLTILEFQEALNVDICQAGYPPAHGHEADAVKSMVDHTRKNKCRIRIAAMGRANRHDADILLATGVRDLHFHVQIKTGATLDELDTLLNGLSLLVAQVKKHSPGACISLAMLDIGRSDNQVLAACASFLSRHKVDILSLPDTSGMMSPNQVFEKINLLACLCGQTAISIHCHDDMGMASANSVMGILAGAGVLEASALGIGERNGIADLYTTAKTLKNQGYDIRLNTEDMATFKAYYDYVDAIVYAQTEEHLLNLNTPVFGDAVKTHVAGTHAGAGYGLVSDEQFFLNILCGKKLVQKFLDAHAIACPAHRLEALTAEIKSKSALLNRCLTKSDIVSLVSSFTD